jgi:predicted nucleic acid-binding protein
LPFADSIDVYAQEKLRLKDSGKPIEDFDLSLAALRRLQV